MYYKMKSKNLTSGLEDYIEAIYIAELNKTQLKGAELARNLNISRASVSEALTKLVDKGLICYESYGVISLTKAGKAEAQNVYGKHSILKNFFETVFDIPSTEAEENACKIEHVISGKILDKMLLMTTRIKNNKDLKHKLFEEV